MSVCVWQSFCKFFTFDIQKLTPTQIKKCSSIDTHNLEVDTYYDFWRKKKYTSIDMLEIEITRITRQLKYYKLQFKYPENITHNIRRISYTHLHT